ncbi:hypothetical protein HZC07_02790 [Candidatus Micrarchaeota archaeon]|nr:hypothetical protein [Candidatus Micrarchaeota archaeon]
MKGQYFSFDAIIASVIFILALVSLLSYWHSVKSYLDYQNDDLSKDAVRIANLLFTPSAPASDCNSIARLGLAMNKDDKRINSSIIDCIQSKTVLGSQWLQDKLGAAYPASINITQYKLNGGRSTYTLSAGPIPSDTKQIVNIRRTGTLVNATTGENYLAVVDLTMYRPA